MPRIVSLIASATEIACALGLRESLVGVSHECDFPEGVASLPRCSAPRIKTEAPSREIHEDLLARLRRGLSIYEVDFGLLDRLKPDVILTQDQCAVCAVSLKDVEKAVCSKVVALTAGRLEGLYDDVRAVAAACGVPERGAALEKDLRARFAALAESVARERARPAVACVEWIDPLMSAGNWMPELVELAGGRSLFGEAGKHSPWLKWEELLAADPDVLLVSPCGFRLEQTRREMGGLTGRPGWTRLRAVRSGRVYLADGNAYFHRPGPRLVESLAILRDLLHPGRFPSAPGWERWDDGF